jgi:hypothetical protein
MNTCGDCHRRPAEAAAPRGRSKGRSRRSSLVEGTSSSGKPAHWRALVGTGSHDWTSATPDLTISRVSSPAVHERCQRVRLGKAAASRQSCGAFSPLARKQEGQPIDPKPASRRQARGCWRPDDRKVVRRRPRTSGARGVRAPKGDLEVERRRVSHDARLESPKRVFAWVLVT